MAARHFLDRPGDGVEAVADALIGFHSSDPASVYLSARARITGFTLDTMEQSLYEDRTVARVLGMRRTMFVVPSRTVAAIHHSSTASMVDGERRRMQRMVEGAGIASTGATWVRDVEERTFEALTSRGEATATELTEDVPELGEKIPYFRSDGTPMGTFGVSTRILFLLATDGRIIRGRPRGTWLSSLYRWAPLESWLGSPLEPMDRALAQKAILARWLASFGPATETDIKWWTGWPLRDVRRALAAMGAIEVALDEGVGYLHPEDPGKPNTSGMAVSFLPSLDPTMMGWKERDWYLGPHAPMLFDRNGNAGPSVWLDGRVVGGWGQRTDGQVIFHLLENLPASVADIVAGEADRLNDWLNGTVVTPRFRTPIEKEILSGRGVRSRGGISYRAI